MLSLDAFEILLEFENENGGFWSLLRSVLTKCELTKLAIHV